jgi:rare lipoprotein A
LISTRILTAGAEPFVRRATIFGLCVVLGACSAGLGAINKGMFSGLIPEQQAAPTSSEVAVAELQPLPGNDAVAVGRSNAALEDVANAGSVVRGSVSGTGYDRVGMASWYGASFHGRRTANGEAFDRTALTAAHPSLPLPSYVRVTNLDNDRSVVVRVNDRGPYTHNRLIDVSEQTAELLGFRRDGMTKVRIQYVSQAPRQPSDEGMLLASYRGPQAAKSRAIAFASAEPQGRGAATALRRLTRSISATDRIFMAFDAASGAEGQ